MEEITNNTNSELIDQWIAYLEESDVEEVVYFDLSKASDIVDYVVLGSAKNTRHMAHVSEDAMRWSKERGYGLIAADGLDSGEWVVLDYGHYMIHLLLPETRYRIDLESFWEKLLAQKHRESENQ